MVSVPASFTPPFLKVTSDDEKFSFPTLGADCGGDTVSVCPGARTAHAKGKASSNRVKASRE
jgi:hypothetical protein